MAAILLASHPLVSFAGDTDLDTLKRQLDSVLERVDKLERENALLHKEVGELRQKLDPRPMDTQRPPPDPVPRSSPPKSAGKTADLPGRDFGLHPGGGGFFIRGDNYELRILGYVQFLASLFTSDLTRADEPGDFSIRRARLDFLATLYDDWEAFIEFDGGPGTTNTGDSDFALVEARLNWKIIGDDLQLRTGKFTTQFSTENARSSRSIDTVERYIALNSMFLLPALDVQFGAMIHGRLLDGNTLTYSLGVYNGNGKANDNISDDNGAKEVQAKIGYAFPNGLKANVAIDISDEEGQSLALADLGFNRYVSVPIEGRRVGFGADMVWERGPYSMRAEGLAVRFSTPGADSPDDHVWLVGGYIQPAYFIIGNGMRGLQALLRAETAHLDASTGDDGDTLSAITGGLNWLINPSIRLQVDGTLHYFNGPSSIRGFSSSRWVPMLLTELQYKF